jgi:hypothetical protein
MMSGSTATGHHIYYPATPRTVPPTKNVTAITFDQHFFLPAISISFTIKSLHFSTYSYIMLALLPPDKSPPPILTNN